MSKSQILNVANMSFNAIRENRVFAKISEFTVFGMSLNLHILCIGAVMALASLHWAIANSHTLSTADFEIYRITVRKRHLSLVAHADISRRARGLIFF